MPNTLRLKTLIKYPCDECEFAATKASHLKQYKEIKHEGKRYPFEYFEYAATQKGALIMHKKRKHNKVNFMILPVLWIHFV